MIKYMSNGLPYCGSKMKVELDLSNYATKPDIQKQQVLIHQDLI